MCCVYGQTQPDPDPGLLMQDDGAAGKALVKLHGWIYVGEGIGYTVYVFFVFYSFFFFFLFFLFFFFFFFFCFFFVH